MRVSIILAILFLGITVSAQKIVMKIKDVLPTAGEPVKALEFKIDAETSWIKGGGAAVGKPVPSELLIKKDNGSFTAELTRRVIMGTNFPEISFEYYSKTDEKAPYYVITAYEAFVTQSHFLSPECPTCLNLENQFGMVFKRIKFDDKLNKVSFTWNIALMKIE